MSKFQCKIDRQGTKLSLQLAGVIDEDADFSPLGLNGAQEVHIDMDGVKSINSCGIREWIKWIGGGAAAKVTYSKCPKVIVDQMNMVDGFLPNFAKVESFYVPYYNEESGSEKNILFRYGVEFKEGQVQPPTEVKDEGGNPMEMDVIENKYFKFVKSKG
ncbi:MAG: hypothetical protein ACK5Y2_05410 [Bdellovibrionales bacterium]